MARLDWWKEDGSWVEARMEWVEGSIGSLSGPREMVLCAEFGRFRPDGRRALRPRIGADESNEASMMKIDLQEIRRG